MFVGGDGEMTFTVVGDGEMIFIWPYNLIAYLDNAILTTPDVIISTPNFQQNRISWIFSTPTIMLFILQSNKLMGWRGRCSWPCKIDAWYLGMLMK